MYSRTYIIGQHESTECPWCAMPLHTGEHATEIVTEKDCIQEGFCCYLCACCWMDDIKDKLIKAVNDWVAGHRPIIDNLPIEAHKMLKSGVAPMTQYSIGGKLHS